LLGVWQVYGRSSVARYNVIVVGGGFAGLTAARAVMRRCRRASSEPSRPTLTAR
jgi:NADPH-dependent 2,4-dienoyl-CoA reductase/sulfur reductase-like enzyme